MDEATGEHADDEPAPTPGTRQAMGQLGKDLEMAFRHYRERAEQGRPNFRITYDVWARRIGWKTGNDITQVTRGHRWPPADMLRAWDREAGFDGLLVMRGGWLHYGTWPSEEQLAAWDGDEHDPVLVECRHRWFSQPPSPPAPAVPPRPAVEPVPEPELGPAPPAARRRRRRGVIVVAVAAVAVVVLVVVVGIMLSARDRSAPVRSPGEGERVCYRHTARGTAAGVRDREQLWLVVRPAMDARMYPQPGGPLVVSSSGEWSGEAFFGTGPDRAGGEGATFVLDVVAAGAEASDALATYLTDGYPGGLIRLPTGTRILARVQVVRAGC